MKPQEQLTKVRSAKKVRTKDRTRIFAQLLSFSTLSGLQYAAWNNLPGALCSVHFAWRAWHTDNCKYRVTEEENYGLTRNCVEPWNEKKTFIQDPGTTMKIIIKQKLKREMPTTQYNAGAWTSTLIFSWTHFSDVTATLWWCHQEFLKYKKRGGKDQKNIISDGTFGTFQKNPTEHKTVKQAFIIQTKETPAFAFRYLTLAATWPTSSSFPLDLSF